MLLRMAEGGDRAVCCCSAHCSLLVAKGRAEPFRGRMDVLSWCRQRRGGGTAVWNQDTLSRRVIQERVTWILCPSVQNRAVAAGPSVKARTAPVSWHVCSDPHGLSSVPRTELPPCSLGASLHCSSLQGLHFLYVVSSFSVRSCFHGVYPLVAFWLGVDFWSGVIFKQFEGVIPLPPASRVSASFRIAPVCCVFLCGTCTVFSLFSQYSKIP